jgi:hypothetical protein
LPVGFIGLVLHFSADRMHMVVVIEPIIVTISNEAKYGFGPRRLHPDDDQTRQPPILYIARLTADEPLLIEC